MANRRNSRSLLDQMEIAEENSQSQQNYDEFPRTQLLEGEHEEDVHNEFQDKGYEDILEPRRNSLPSSCLVDALIRETPGESSHSSRSSFKHSSFRGSMEFSVESMPPSSQSPSIRGSSEAELRSPIGNDPTLLPTSSSTHLRSNRVTLTSPVTSEAGSSSNPAGGAPRGGRIMQSLLERFNKSQSTALMSAPRPDPTLEAVSRLGATNSDLDHVVAAAAPKPRGTVLFSKGNHCLVMLTMLGIADRDDQRDLYTVDPVNVHGYPAGEGKEDHHKQGPFMFVLCVVTQVHFDEDERYYTVRRCDTGAKQRADPGFMEPIRDETVDVAYRAAKRCGRTMNDGHESVGAETPSWFVRTSRLWLTWWFGTVVPNYVRNRDAIKSRVTSFLDGDPGFGLNLHFSGVNFLVLCSLVFLFQDVVALAFAPPELDRTLTIVGIVVWAILVVELLFEVLLRPRNYGQLVRTDKAFLPSTARHINMFHLVFEAIALLLFLPQVVCISDSLDCSEPLFLSRAKAPVFALTSSLRRHTILGRLDLSLTFLRAFGLMRHWKQMWINSAFQEEVQKEPSFMKKLMFVKEKSYDNAKKYDDENAAVMGESRSARAASKLSSEDRLLKNAASIGTALMIINSHRAMALLLFIVSAFPLLYSVTSRNALPHRQALYLQETNLVAPTADDCDYLQDAVRTWLSQASFQADKASVFQQVEWVQLLPIRCEWQEHPRGYIFCDEAIIGTVGPLCDSSEEDFDVFVKTLVGQSEARASAFSQVALGGFPLLDSASANEEFVVKVLFNETRTISTTYFSLFLLLLGFVITALWGMSVMRADAERLVLFPLTKMLMIIVRYAENPLSTPASQLDEGGQEELGQYETEQLISAIAKIADLLRKCWGVAGADIISSNLARTKDGKTVVFNPTIPGKQVYALFGFVGINDFSKQLRMLEKDVMILINDVARVVHDEVYRWGHSSSGQCNKNLGSAFLMVFRIGDFSEVHDKKKRATDVVFSSQMKNMKVRQRQNTQNKRLSSGSQFDIGNTGTLQLASLPGIQAFADRAVLGFLKSFAGLHRDQNMQNWQQDFRLGAGVGRYKIDVLYGMDAGWAVEGAVGSEYKIDATYLSPHVNMASRCMSACKQYGVKVLLSQAVEELLSKEARSKMRHLDTVYVKGSNVEQRIYTYDARHEGVDFFLFERSPDQADIEADAYNPSIWENDQDLRSMRQHVTEEFMQTFSAGLEKYIEGKWKEAIRKFQRSENLMFEEVVEQGFVEYMNEDLGEYGKITCTSRDDIDRLKEEFGDGASRCLIQFMQKYDGIPPPDWHGVRHLTSK